jgi:hypothetical protein
VRVHHERREEVADAEPGVQPAAHAQPAEEARHPAEHRRPDRHAGQEAEEEERARRPVDRARREAVADDPVADDDVLARASHDDARVRVGGGMSVAHGALPGRSPPARGSFGPYFV